MNNKFCNSLSRRDFLRMAGVTALAGCGINAHAANVLATPELREALHYRTLDEQKIQCMLCPWQCTVANWQRGTCGVRENRNGRYYTLTYGRPCAIHNDPIEKKPFFHVYPGSKAFSIATVGCNIDCKFCQNWDISQKNPDDISVPFKSPQEIAQRAVQAKSRTVAYTYSEPTIFFEYMLDCAMEAKQLGLGNIVVSNGFINEEPLKQLCKIMTAIKIDLKSFSQQFYGKMCNGRLKPVLNTLERLAGSGVWFEIVVLVIPTLNDNLDEIKRMSEWIVKHLGPDIPLHFTRFHPAYKLQNLPSTPAATLSKVHKTAKEQGCNFVYGGNMPGIKTENTYCPKCQHLLVDRYGMTLISDELKEGKCPKCGTSIPGVWR